MRKRLGLLGMAAAMVGLGALAQAAGKEAENLKESLNDMQQPIRFPPDYGITPRQYGTYIATRQSNIVKSKRRSKVAFG